MLHRRQSKSSMASPGPTYMSNERMDEYLNDLRNNRPQRPTGARPCPSPSVRRSLNGSMSRNIPPSRDSASSTESKSIGSTTRQSIEKVSSRTSDERPSSAGYIESEQRRKEKEEARKMRFALETIDTGEGQQADTAAKAEVDELIRKHEHPEAPYKVSNTPVIEDGTEVPSAESRTANQRTATAPSRVQADTLPSIKKRSSIARIAEAFSNTVTPAHRRKSSGQARRTISGKHKSLFADPDDKIYEDPDERPKAVTSASAPVSAPVPAPISEPLPDPVKPVNGPVKRSDSGVPAHVRRNPFARAQAAREGRSEVPYKLPTRTSTSDSRPSSSDKRDCRPQSRSEQQPEAESQKASTEEEALKFKNGVEVRSDELRAATSFSLRNRSAKLPSPTAVSDSSKRPIVSFKPDWTPPRLEEEQRREQQSPPKRPSPFGRRIVDNVGEEPIKSASAPTVPTLRHPESPGIQVNNGRIVGSPLVRPGSSARRSPSPPAAVQATTPSIEVSAPPSINISEAPPSIPTINEPDNEPPIPQINVSNDDEPSIPQIHIPDESETKPRPLPTINAPTSSPHSSSNKQPKATPNRARPPAIHAATAPSAPRSLHGAFPASAVRRATALCSQCGLPISGKIVTAAGVRFHPECFTCHTCSTQLECVAFYPEPGPKREERLERIRRRSEGEDVEGVEEDGDDGLRFFCHLDFHELFSPRCKSCKTPIEGEVVVACGAEWHVGHFFCAECGDVSSSSPFSIPSFLPFLCYPTHVHACHANTTTSPSTPQPPS